MYCNIILYFNVLAMPQVVIVKPIQLFIKDEVNITYTKFTHANSLSFIDGRRGQQGGGAGGAGPGDGRQQ
jgi:hypothetical protein